MALFLKLGVMVDLLTYRVTQVFCPDGLGSERLCDLSKVPPKDMVKPGAVISWL